MKKSVYIIICLIIFFFFIVFTYTERCYGETNSDSLKYLGNAFVKITTSEGKIVYIDPYAIDQSDSADIVLITHEHSDHNDLSRVKQKSTCQVIRVANALLDAVYQTFTIGNITIKAVPAYNQYHSKSQGVGYVIEFDGIKVYHAGGTGKIPEMADLSGQNIAYALLPMTPGPELMTQAAALIQANHDIPIHTTVSLDRIYDTALVARFTSPNKLIVLTDQTIELTKPATNVEEACFLNFEYRLFQNYPNPFNPATIINFRVSVAGSVRLSIFDILGREVAVLVNENKYAGSYSVQWNAEGVPSGVYFCRLKAGSYVQTKKLVMQK